jgi:hypothetical protein
MNKKVLNSVSFFDDNAGDIIDRIIREEEIIKNNPLSKKKPKRNEEDLRLDISDLDRSIISDISLNIIAEEYHKNINTAESNALLKEFKITNPGIISRFKIGYCNGSMTGKLSENQKKELIRQEILNDDGSESFAGFLTIPLYENEHVSGIAGLKEDGATKIIGNSGMIWNMKATRVYDEIIFTDKILSGLSIILAGCENVISIEGMINLPGNWIKELKDNRVKSVIIAFEDKTESGILKDLLLIDDFRIKEIFPPFTASWNNELKKGMNKDSLDYLINKAEVKVNETKSGLNVVKDISGYRFKIGEIAYNLTGIKDVFINNLKIKIRVQYNNDWFPDTVDLYVSRSRDAFSLKLSQRFNVEPKKIEKDLLMILDYLEKERDKSLATGSNLEKPELTEEERRIGLEFLKSPDMFEQIVNDMSILGYVGENLNKELLYLCATSRLMNDPISVLIVSQSASGKSYLVETVAKLLPADEVVDFNTLSKQALQYMGDRLLNKFMMMGEAVHDPDIEHQLRVILSEHKLSRYVVVKNEKTGEMTTEQKFVRANVSSVLTTTNNKINPENASRYFITNTDESEKQTKLIYQAQRNKYSEERQAIKKNIIPDIIKKHHAAQRILRKITLVIPSLMRDKLRFPDNIMRLRRDHERFIDLIACVCFLRQYQKEVKSSGDFEYIECDKTDYRIAYNILINGILHSTISEIPQQSIMLYEAIRGIVKEDAKVNGLKPVEIGVTQREIRESAGFNQMFVKRYIKILVEYEYLKVKGNGTRGGKGEYSLVADEDLNRIDISMILTPDEMDKILQ